MGIKITEPYFLFQQLAIMMARPTLLDLLESTTAMNGESLNHDLTIKMIRSYIFYFPQKSKVFALYKLFIVNVRILEILKVGLGSAKRRSVS